MVRVFSWLPTLVLISSTLAACGGSVLTSPDAADAGANSDAPTVNRTLTIINPSGPVSTNGVLHLAVQWTGAPPSRVELFVDDVFQLPLPSPATGYDWDTHTTTEGPHRLTMRGIWPDLTLTTPPRTVQVDRTAPTVLSRTPEPGASNVDVQTPIVVTFSEAIDPSRLTLSTVGLTDGRGRSVPRTYMLSPDGRTLTILPSAGGIDSPTALTVTLGHDVGDLSGNLLVQPAMTWTWQVPAWLSRDTGLIHPGGMLVTPTFAMDRSGGLFVAAPLVTPGSTTARSTVAGRWDGTSWSWLGTPQLNRIDAVQASSVRMLVTPTNTPVVAWQELYPNNTAAAVVKVWSDNLWQTAGLSQETQSLTLAGCEPSITVSETGTLYMAVSQMIEQRQSVWVRGLVDATWTNLLSGLVIPDITSVQRQPVIVAAPRGQMYVAFNQDSVNGTSLQVLRAGVGSWDSLGQMPPAAVSSGIDEPPSITLDDMARPIVGWIQRMSTPVGAALNVMRWDGVAWNSLGNPISLPGTVGMQATQLSVKSTAQGVIWASWASGSSLNLMSFNPMTGWTPFTTMPMTSTTGLIDSVSLLVDDHNRPILAWSQRTGMGTESLFVRVLNR